MKIQYSAAELTDAANKRRALFKATENMDRSNYNPEDVLAFEEAYRAYRAVEHIYWSEYPNFPEPN